MLKVSFSIDRAWFLSKRDEMISPVDLIAKMLRESFQVDSVHTGLTEGEVIIGDDAVEKSAVEDAIVALLKEQCKVEDTTAILELAFENVEKVKEPQEPDNPAPAAGSEAAEAKNKPAAEEAAKPKKQSAAEACRNLVGAEEFKALAEECTAIAPGLCAHDVRDAFVAQCYLFSVNDGCGFTTYISLFADLLAELNLYHVDPNNKMVEVMLKSDKQAEETFKDALNAIQKMGKKRLLCIDMSEWMTKMRDADFRNFLKELNRKRLLNDYIVIFRVPFIEKNVLMEIKEELCDVMSTRTVSVPPFCNSELTEIASQRFADKGFTVEEDAWESFEEKIREEKNDGRFYGINTIHKIVHEVIYRKHLDDARAEISDCIIRKDDVAGTLSEIIELHTDGIEALDKMIGMETIKKRVEEIVAQIEVSLRNSALERPCIHMRFLGSPGTGKTTVARIIGNILKEKGILRNGAFLEYGGRDFCGRYVGETAPKTAAICRDAYGSVLFIDEAYSLFRTGRSDDNDFGREVLDTLVAEMENHRTDLVVIMAGYTDEMERMMTGNPGLKSRMPFQIDFPNYTREQLAEIFLSMASSKFTLADGLEKAVRDYFSALPDALLEAKDFSNARYVRNLYERTWGKAVLRCQMAQLPCTELTAEDFAQASSDSEFQDKGNIRRKPLGFQ